MIILETKIKSYGDKINTNFHENRIPKQSSHCVCLSVILTDSVFKMGKSHQSQVFFEECKYSIKEKEMNKIINDKLEIYSDESDKEIFQEDF